MLQLRTSRLGDSGSKPASPPCAGDQAPANCTHVQIRGHPRSNLRDGIGQGELWGLSEPQHLFQEAVRSSPELSSLGPAHRTCPQDMPTGHVTTSALKSRCGSQGLQAETLWVRQARRLLRCDPFCAAGRPAFGFPVLVAPQPPSWAHWGWLCSLPALTSPSPYSFSTVPQLLLSNSRSGPASG